MNGSFLVIDDEKSLRITFASFLEDAGGRVMAAGSVADALALLESHRFDVIVSDIRLGTLTGLDLLAALRGKGVTAPVIMITGYPTIETAVEAMQLGAFDYLTKPVTKEMLLRAVEKAFAFKQLRDQNETFQARIEGIFRSISDAIITIDRDGCLTSCNATAERFCGLSGKDLGKQATTLPQLAIPALQSLLQGTLRNRITGRAERLEMHFGTDRSRVVSLISTPLLLASGEFDGAVLVLRDETRLNELEKTLKGRRQMQGIIGKSSSMQEIYALIEDLADMPSTVLINGESGTGKELVAEALHYRGSRRNGPLVKVNCAALSETLLESELFGHVRGAFTGAVQARVGRFQKADGGTLFLDEIGDISPAMQTRLLRVLQEKQIERVGDSTTIDVDVRVVTATNQKLLAKVRRGEFREDLYYRLKVVTLELPPLRERYEDLPLLVEHFQGMLNSELNRRVEGISPQVLEIFMDYSWPGNIRELKHVLEYAFIRCRESIVEVQHLPAEMRQGPIGLKADTSQSEEDAICDALRRTGGNKAKAAKILGIDRKTLYRKLEKYTIDAAEAVDY